MAVSAEEVALELVVHDKKGHPVSDLKPTDLKVEDGGEAISLNDLRLINAGEGQRYITLLFDNMDPLAKPEARAIAGHLLKLIPSNKFALATLTVDGRLRLLQPLTSEREQTKMAIREATGSDKQDVSDKTAAAEKELIASAKAGADAQKRQEAGTLLAALKDSQRIVLEQHARPALAGLLALSRAEAQLPGRKAIVFFTQGLRLNASFREVMQALIGAANRSGVSIYGVDLSALDTASDAMAASIVMARAGGAGQSGIASSSATGPIGPSLPGGEITMASEQGGRIENGTAEIRTSPLADLCTHTAGAYIAAGDNTGASLRRMIADLSSYYEAFYVPPISQYDGSFRKVSITVNRRGLKIQAPAGYFALPNSAAEGMRPFEAPLLKILDSPLPDDLAYRSAILHAGETAEGDANYLTLEVPLKDIEFREDTNTRLVSFHLSMVARIKDKDGTVVESFSDDLPRHGALEAKEQYRGDVVTIQRHFTLDPGNYELETVVQDRNTGKTGAQQSAFTIAKEHNAPALSDVLLVRRTETLKSAEDSGELFQFDGARIIPNISGILAPDHQETEFFFLVFPAAHGPEPKLELQILAADGQSLGRAPLKLRSSTGGKPLSYEVGVHTVFPPGHYSVKAILTQGAQSVERSLSFAVEGSLAEARPRDAVSIADTSVVHGTKQLAIVPAAHSSDNPSSEMLAAILAGAKLRALEYITSLPNFTCIEVTNRSVDPDGGGTFHHRDTLAELVRFRDNFEHRVMLKINNQDTDQDRSGVLGTLTHGEFGGMLNAVFNPEAKAEFTWKGTESLNDDSVQVFEYHVKLAHSTFSITAANGQIAKVGFRGCVYIDEITRAVRRLTMDATDLPVDFPTRSAAFSIDYDYVAIGDHDYLMPSSGSVKAGTGKRMLVLNEFEFRNYQKYGAESTVHFDR
jgi:VWFA-related protein